MYQMLEVMAWFCYNQDMCVKGGKKMKKIFRKILPALMVLIMVVSAIPMSAFNVSAATSGACGENVSFKFNSSTGTLTISGTGEMENYYLTDDRPWVSYEDNIKKVIINNGVKSIGQYAFYSCESLTSITIPDGIAIIKNYALSMCRSLTSITIPDSVTTIGREAFYDCYSLTSVNIPDSVTTIGDEAFSSCDGLKKVTIGDGVGKIGQEAFYGCAGLTSITIPESVTSIGYKAFDVCSNLTEIFVEENNRYYSSDEYGVLFNKERTNLIKYPNGNARDCYTIPEGVISITGSAFRWCKNLTSITIPEGVTSIGENAFSDCRSLTSVNLPDSLTYIGGHAFAYCLKLTGSLTIPDSVKTIGSCAFLWCSNLTSVEIGKNVTTIDGNAFQYCRKIRSITIPNGVTEIDGFVFSGCSNLNIVTIPDSVTLIVYAAFDDTHLTDVYYCGSESEWDSIVIGNSNQSLLNARIHYNYHLHEYASVVTPPTCTEQGYTTYTCECGDSYVSDYVDANGHTSDEWIYDTLPSIYDTGIKHKVCDECGEIFDEDTVAEKIIPDINGDGKVNSMDALIILNMSVGNEVNISDEATLRTDVNGDGKVNSMDALIVLNIAVGKIKLED